MEPTCGTHTHAGFTVRSPLHDLITLHPSKFRRHALALILLCRLAMKRPSSKPALRAKALDSAALQKASGGRGVVHGYWECDNCGAVTDSYSSYCYTCGCSFSSGNMDPSFFGLDPYFY